MAVVYTGLHPVTLRAIEILSVLARRNRMPFRVTSAFRDLRKQAELVRSGRAITPAAPGRSTHNYGLAFDAVSFGHQLELAELGTALGLVWGGPTDPVHFQIVTQADWAAFLAAAGL